MGTILVERRILFHSRIAEVPIRTGPVALAIAFQAVIPANAGIQGYEARALDPGFRRGDDWGNPRLEQI